MGKKVQVIGAADNVFVRVTPDHDVPVRLRAEDVDTWAVAELRPRDGGGFDVVATPIQVWQPLSRATVRKLHIHVSMETLERLGAAGFIRVRKVSPRSPEFHLGSWFEHCRAVEDDPDYWTEERIDRYRLSYTPDAADELRQLRAKLRMRGQK